MATTPPADMFELVTRALNVAYYEWLPATDELRVSKAFLDLFGYDAATWSTRRVPETMHPDDQAGYRAELLGFLRGSSDHLHRTYRVRVAGGEYRWFRDQATVERDASGRVTRMVGAASDITEARQREADLREANRTLATRDEQNRTLIARQAASIEVLKTISASPDDPQPAFDLIARRARELCDAQAVVVLEYDGGAFNLRAIDGHDPEAAVQLRQAFPRPAGPDTMSGRSVLTGHMVQTSDLQVEPGIFGPGRGLGARSCFAVPLLREGRAIGSIFLSRFEIRDFDAAEIALVESFAEQAVIAIASANALRDLRARTGDLQEALEQQTATSEVLQVINASPGDLRPVFDAMLERAMKLCEAAFGELNIFDGERFRTVAPKGVPPAYSEFRLTSAGIDPRAGTIGRRLREGATVLHLADLKAEEAYANGNPDRRALVDLGGARTALLVALRKDDALLGGLMIYRQEVRPFSGRQIALLENFAAQAVIAIENTRLITEQREALERQTATAEVLQVINASPGNLEPVFEAILEKAHILCGVTYGSLQLYDGEMFRAVAVHGFAGPMAERLRAGYAVGPNMPQRRLIAGEPFAHVDDFSQTNDPVARAGAELGGIRTILFVALRKDDVLLGQIVAARLEVRPFTAKEIALVRNFAAQAVIAMENARLLGELQVRTAALAERNRAFQEQVEHQAATIDVLKVMSSTTSDTHPVFDIIVRRAMHLCNGVFGGLFEFDGELLHVRAAHGFQPDALADMDRRYPRRPTGGAAVDGAILDRKPVHIRDFSAESVGPEGMRNAPFKAYLAVPLLREGTPIGVLAVAHENAGGFSDAHVDLLKTFAEQAVIAIGSVATFRELQERTAELTRSVAELQALEEVLRAVNSSLDLETVLATIINRAVPLAQADEGMIYEFDAVEKVFVPKAAFGMTEDRIARLRERRIRIGETYLGRSVLERVPVHVADVQQDPSTPEAKELLQGVHAVLAVPLLREDAVVGGLVIRRHTEGAFQPATVALMQTFAAQCVLAIENARLFEDSRRARAAAEVALADLRRAQDRLVQAEKMASLGQLTAGIAHEIKNPLNFVNNFSDLSGELLDELLETLGPDARLRGEIDDLATTLKSNLQKIAEHGKRADGIVKNMLLHSRSGPVESRPVDLDAICEEALNLAYHGARANTPDFNITLEKDLGQVTGTVEMFPQDFTRALLNLIGNGFYAARKRAGQAPGFEPTLRLSTRDLGDEVEIRVRDNGTGIAIDVREKIFDPFFTTKPAGEGTGLGLSLTFDIVVKQHGGQLRVATEVDSFTEFVVTLPRSAPGGPNS